MKRKQRMAPKLETQLFKAAIKGDLQEVERLIDAGADMTARSAENQPPIPISAAAKGQALVLDLMVRRGLDLNFRFTKIRYCDWLGESNWDYAKVSVTLLEEIMQLRKQPATEFLLAWYRERDGLERGTAEFFREAIRHPSSPTPTPFMRATRPPDSFTYPDGATVAQVLDSMKNRSLAAALRKLKPAVLEAGSGSKPTKATLLAAAKAGDVGGLRGCLAEGLDVNTRLQSNGTPLSFAAAGGHELAVEFLLSSGADVELANTGGFRALEKAIEAGSVPCVRMLLQAGTKVGPEALGIGADHDAKGDIVRLLLEAGAGAEGLSEALLRACDKSRLGAVQALLDAGADPNCIGQWQMRPLHFACFSAHNFYIGRYTKPSIHTPRAADTKIALLLLERGADPMLKDHWQRDIPNCPHQELASVQAVKRWLAERGR